MKQQTIKDFIKKHDIRLKLEKIPFRTDIEWEGNPTHYVYTLYTPYGDMFGKTIRGYYSQGEAIKKAPTAEDILNALILDTQQIEIFSFEDFCSEFGYDNDSIKAQQIYQSCLKEYQQMLKMFGSELLEELRQCETL